MTRPRAADDFPMIRARMEELRRDRARPRAADDFSTIRARVVSSRISTRIQRPVRLSSPTGRNPTR